MNGSLNFDFLMATQQPNDGYLVAQCVLFLFNSKSNWATQQPSQPVFASLIGLLGSHLYICHRHSIFYLVFYLCIYAKNRGVLCRRFNFGQNLVAQIEPLKFGLRHLAKSSLIILCCTFPFITCSLGCFDEYACFVYLIEGVASQGIQ